MMCSDTPRPRRLTGSVRRAILPGGRGQGTGSRREALEVLGTPRKGHTMNTLSRRNFPSKRRGR